MPIGCRVYFIGYDCRILQGCLPMVFNVSASSGLHSLTSAEVLSVAFEREKGSFATGGADGRMGPNAF